MSKLAPDRQAPWPVPRPAVEFFILAGFLALNALALHFLARQRFDPVDYAGFLDTGWRAATGQKMYSDFFYHAGPVFPYALAFFFKLLGFNQTAILTQLILTSAGALLLVYGIFRKQIPFSAVMLVTACTLTGFHWIYPFPFYTQLSFLLGLTGLAVLTRLLDADAASRDFFLEYLFCGALGVFIYMTKQTEGIFFGGVYLALLLAVPKGKGIAAAGFAAGFLIMALIFVWLIGDLERFWLNTIVFPMNEKYRFAWFINPLNYLQNFYWPVVLVVGAQALRYRSKFCTELLFLAGSAGIGVASFIAGSLKSVVFAPLLGFCFGFSFLLLSKMESIERDAQKLRWIVLSRRLVWMLGGAFLLYCVFFCGGIALHKLKVGEGVLFDVNVPNTHTLQTPDLSGWKTPPNFGSDLDLVTAYVQENIPKDEVLLALRPWMIVYGLTGREGFKGMETLDLTFDDSAPLYEILRKPIVENPPDWILTYKHPKAPMLLLNATTRQLKLDRWIYENYALAEHWQYAVLFRRNKPSS